MFTENELATILQALQMAKASSIDTIKEKEPGDCLAQMSAEIGKCFVKDIDEITDKIYKLLKK